jgi:hypothetical protein
MVRREKQRTKDDNALLLATGLFQNTQYGVVFAKEPPETLMAQLRSRLAERRVVQHLPGDMSGMHVEENTRGVESIDEKGVVHLKQVSRDERTGKLTVKRTTESASKLIGLRPGKLNEQKGVRVISDNYGVAILDTPPPKPDGTPGDPKDRFAVIPFAGVWRRLKELRKLNGEKQPVLLRQGTLIHVPSMGSKKNSADYRGIWMLRGSTDNAKSGVLLEICWPDVVNSREAGVKWTKQNVSLASLWNEGAARILLPSLTGQAIAITT